MKNNILLSITLGIISLFGTNSCSSGNITKSEVQAQQEIKIVGSSSTYQAAKILATAYENKTGNVKLTFLPKSQSSSGIAGVKKGFVDIGTVSRTLKPEEDDTSVVYREFVQDALVVGIHPSVEGVRNLQTSQLKAIYSGRVTKWQDLGGSKGKIVVLDRPEDESGKRLLREYYLGKELQNAPEAVIMRHEPELVNALNNTPYSIGTFSLAYALSNKLSVKRLSLNNIEATTQNVLAGKYKMVRKLGIVYSKKPTPKTQGFVDFIFSEQGQEVLRRSGFVPSLEES
ncbi:substrate-binding domain-containing protein [Mastigocoleus testarum]|uniref:Phosphate ABC transporter substrate-binding protein n=1 Tax=Mastigocoleus testarum BC008 TaxID=371196 RepID=A0A0V7ZQB3_9CYAN|nr:substrate-binding domain-containing protein [Mastigocoleus testarum]KST66594.1 phosphate ABC transporter substrate-binding protein [Mastigocoleus testarum BC008]